MSSELCKSCIHHEICISDKNLFGDVFTAGHPMFFDNEKLYEEFKKWEAEGFPCKHYVSINNTVDVVRCEECKYAETVNCPMYRAHFGYTDKDYCSCGVRKEQEKDG